MSGVSRVALLEPAQETAEYDVSNNDPFTMYVVSLNVTACGCWRPVIVMFPAEDCIWVKFPAAPVAKCNVLSPLLVAAIIT